MDDEQAVLRANGAFYTAFASADFTTMTEVWAHDDGIACIHPGWDVLTGYHDVMESWRTILEGGAAPRISCRAARAFLFGDVAFVTCNEMVNGGLLIATNVFVLKDGGGAWSTITQDHVVRPNRRLEPARATRSINTDASRDTPGRASLSRCAARCKKIPRFPR